MNALTAKEAEAWTSEMARVTNMTIREILEAADRNNIDRDSAVQFFADLFLTMTSVATFKHFDLGGDPHEQGFATKYRHGNAGSISGLTGNGKEIAIHNHPRDGWPTFSKEDVINTALGTRRGIVAVSTKTGRGDDTARYAGVYTFTKGTHFNASGFVKAVNSAQLSGKDYNDAVSKWLKANQQKFGYKYSYQKAK